MSIPFMLAKEYVEGMSKPRSDENYNPPIGWFVSEKYDGYRSRFMGSPGGGKRFMSRQNKLFHSPNWFKEAMPPGVNLDGELWVGREDFQKMGIVRKKKPEPTEWVIVKYIVYDLPDLDLPFEARLKELQKIIKKNTLRWDIIRKDMGEPYSSLECPVQIAIQTKVKSHEHLDTLYQDILEKGGEGVMIKSPDSMYEDKRSNYMLKYKPTYDAEAIIIDYKKGQGKYTGLLGGFVCKQLINHDTYMSIDEMESHIFTTSGMDDAIRKNYKKTHPIGTIISYECSGTTDTGKPRFARYVRKRDDITIKEHKVDETSRENVLRILNELGTFEKNNGELFKANAYFKAVKGLETVPLTEESILSIKGVGKGLCEKILVIIETGTCPAYEKIKDYKDPRSTFLNIYGVGPKKANDLASSGYTSMDDLRKLDNIEEIFNKKQLIGIKYYEEILERIPRKEITKHEVYLKKTLSKIDKCAELTISGSYRRGQKTSGDIDILIKPSYSCELKDIYTPYINLLKKDGYITEVLAKGAKKFMGLAKLDNVNRRIDIMVTTPDEYPFAVLYFTGSKEFNLKMREKALSYGYTMNEYCLTYVEEGDHSGDRLEDAVFEKEEDIFDFLEMDYVEPCER